jgi:hypothetical protein
MPSVGIVNNRTVIYQKHSLELNWGKEMPEKNWLLIAVVDDANKTILREIINKAIAKNVCYTYSLGKQGELFHDMFDEEIVFREVDPDGYYLPPHFVMTSWNNDDIKEGLWYSAFAANNPDVEIKTIYCLNLTDLPIEESLSKLINNI